MNGGGSLSDFLSQLELGGQCWCYVDVRGGSGFSIPSCDAVFVYAVLQGDVRVTCAVGSTVLLRKGDVAFVLSGEAHAVRDGGESLVRPLAFLREGTAVDMPPTIVIGDAGAVSARVLAARLAADWPRQIRRKSLPAVLHWNGDEKAAGSLLRPDAMHSAGVGGGSAALLTRLAALMLVEALRAHPLASRHTPESEQGAIAAALRLIEEDPAANWSVERLARQVGMGRSNFAARFKEQVGRAPMDMVLDERMRRAADLLKTTDLKIADVGQRVGYSSEAAFSRRFRQHFGTFPSKLRTDAAGSSAGGAASVWHVLLANDGDAARGGATSAQVARPLRAVVGLTRFSR